MRFFIASVPGYKMMGHECSEIISEESGITDNNIIEATKRKK
jgi:hypothetical protein